MTTKRSCPSGTDRKRRRGKKSKTVVSGANNNQILINRSCALRPAFGFTAELNMWS